MLFLLVAIPSTAWFFGSVAWKSANCFVFYASNHPWTCLKPMRSSQSSNWNKVKQNQSKSLLDYRVEINSVTIHSLFFQGFRLNSKDSFTHFVLYYRSLIIHLYLLSTLRLFLLISSKDIRSLWI